MIKVFKNIRAYDYFEYWTTDDFKINDLMRLEYAELSLMIETCSSRHQTILRNLSLSGAFRKSAAQSYRTGSAGVSAS